MTSFWNNRKKLLADIRSGRNLAKIKARGKKIRKCPICNKYISEEELEKNSYICKCGGYFPIPALKRIDEIMDASYEVIDFDISFSNKINYPNYDRKYLNAHIRTGLKEAVVLAKGKILSYPCLVFAMEKEFFMGSMALNTGKIIRKAIEIAQENSLPLISFALSGGARMQEGIFSLMQMANTVNALSKFLQKNLYISVLTNPTMGGVTASFASLGDIIIAEKDAHIGFSGPRVIEKTLNIKLSEDFQSAELLLENGFVDAILCRKEIRQYLGKILSFHEDMYGN